jgi:dolichol kinase
MSEAAKIRQALDVSAAVVKLALLLTVMWAGLYLWQHTLIHLWILCMWLAVSIVGMLVYRVRKRKLKALDPD